MGIGFWLVRMKRERHFGERECCERRCSDRKAQGIYRNSRWPVRERIEVYAEDSGKFMRFEVEGNVERARF